MNFLDRQIDKIDNFQKRSRGFGFAYAVIRKYGEDRSAHNGALITYYGFLSFFPLLIVVTAVLQLIIGNSPELHAKLLADINNYFPVLGKDLNSNIHGFHRSGFGLVFGVLVTIYGVRGIADILRFTLNQVWHVPLKQRPGFPNNLLNSLTLIFIGGVGIILSTIFSVYASSLGHGAVVRIFSSLLSFVILILIIYAVFRIAVSSRRVPAKSLLMSALITAVSFQILESLGGYIITHELKNLSTLYGTFAVVLGMFFWIYLLSQAMIYALQISAVSHFKLWPRAINQNQPTAADRKIADLEKISY